VKIAYISGSVVPSRAANSVHVMKMCAAFTRTGSQPVLLAVRGEGYSQQQSFDYYGITEPFEIRWVTRPRVKGQEQIYGTLAAVIAHLSGCDLIYGRHVRGCWTASLSRTKPIVFEAHHPVEGGSRINAILFRHMIKQPNFLGLVVITRALERHFLDNYPALDGRIHVASDGADAPDRHAISPIAESSGRMNVGYVGNLYAGRGIELIIELARRCVWADFHIVGGLDADIEYWRARASHIKNLEFHGFYPPGKLDGIRAAMDVLLAPYQHEVAVRQKTLNTSDWMSPLKIFEYMAAGKAIIASDLPPLREVLSNSNALLVPPDRIDDWVNAVETMRDAEVRECLGKRAFVDFSAMYSWTQRARRIESQLKAWMASRG
jgi:glycosyltransferase involved in cell wall biosynthesis